MLTVLALLGVGGTPRVAIATTLVCSMPDESTEPTTAPQPTRPATTPQPAQPAAAPQPAQPATAPQPARRAAKHGSAGRRNAVVLGTIARIPDWATSLTYQRALGRRFSLGAGLEYGYQPNGYWHLQGVGESLSGQLWFGRPFHGVFAEGSLTVFHQFLVREPRLSTTALAPGLSLGYRWTHRNGLTVGGSAGLRWGRVVGDSDLVCSRPRYCTSVRQGPNTRITFDLGYVF